MNGSFLYQARPDLFPEGYLTPVEIELWNIFEDFKKDIKHG
jgi:hypothetical protein